MVVMNLPGKEKNRLLKQRAITAVVLALTLIFTTVLLPSFWFAFFMSVLALVASWEWCKFIGLRQVASKLAYFATLASTIIMLYFFLGITPSAESINSHRASAILALGVLFWTITFLMLKGYPSTASRWNEKSKIALMGLLALIPAWVGLIQLKFINPIGYPVLALIIMVAAADIGAYFTGKAFGRNKLAPNISPNKTWEGVWGGLCASLFIGFLLIWLLHNYISELSILRGGALMLLCGSVTFFGIIGDLLESMLKRNQNLKDSGSILPGHGGLLDRVDGLLAATPIFVLAFLLID